MSIYVNGEEREFVEGQKVIDLLGDNRNIITCKINNKLRDLSYVIKDGSKIDLLGFNDEDSIRVYEASLRYLFVMALNRCYKDLKVTCDYFVSRSICFKLNEGLFSEEQFDAIKNMMKDIVEKDYLFVRETIDIEEAKKILSLKAV